MHRLKQMMEDITQDVGPDTDEIALAILVLAKVVAQGLAAIAAAAALYQPALLAKEINEKENNVSTTWAAH